MSTRKPLHTTEQYLFHQKKQIKKFTFMTILITPHGNITLVVSNASWICIRGKVSFEKWTLVDLVFLLQSTKEKFLLLLISPDCRCNKTLRNAKSSFKYSVMIRPRAKSHRWCWWLCIPILDGLKSNTLIWKLKNFFTTYFEQIGKVECQSNLNQDNKWLSNFMWLTPPSSARNSGSTDKDRSWYVDGLAQANARSTENISSYNI